MEERGKHKIMIGIEVVLLCMIMTIIGTNAESSNPPSSGVSYSKNSQTTVEGALNDLYKKANYGNATAAQILKGKTALVGGKQVTGSMTNKGAVTGTVSPGGTYTIEAGYHNGSGKVTASSCPSCPTCPEWKVQSFNKRATVNKSFDGSWVGITTQGSPTVLEIDLGFTPSQVGDLYVEVTSVDDDRFFRLDAYSGDKNIRYSNIRFLGVQYTADDGGFDSVGGVKFTNSFDGIYTQMKAKVDGSRVRVTFYTNGTSPLITNATGFVIKGLMMYK